MKFTATAVQPSIQLPYPSKDTFDANAVSANVQHTCLQIKRASEECGSKLVVFPEFFLTGYTLGVGVDGWRNVSVRFPGPEIDALCEAAVQNNVYVAGAAYEVIDAFPGRFFNTAFLISPAGEVVLKYRKLYAMTTKTRPGDVLDEWIALFGSDSLLPVAETSIGRIGALIARDTHWPELARNLALKGAEILLVHNAAGAEPSNGGKFARASRAYENHCYLICSNIGPFIANGKAEAGSGRAPTEIIDYEGNQIAGCEQTDPTWVNGEIDLEKLRRFRCGESPKGNFLAQFQPQLHAPIYNSASLFPSNKWRDTPISEGSENALAEKEVIERMIQSNLLIAPKTN